MIAPRGPSFDNPGGLTARQGCAVLLGVLLAVAVVCLVAAVMAAKGGA